MSYTPPDKFTAHLIQKGLASLDVYHAPHSGIWGPKSKEAYAEALRLWEGRTSDERPPSGAARNKMAERIVAAAVGEVGVTEQGGNNRGERIVAYQSATWLEPSPWPWCAAFVCWCVVEALKGHQAPADFNRPRTAGAWDFERWAREDGGDFVELVKPADEPKAGDICVFTFSHIGIVEKTGWHGGAAMTIEGNTNAAGSREGDGVYRKRRPAGKIRSLIRFEF